MPLAALRAYFAAYPAPVYWLAYSGGLDSHVLIHAAAALRQQQPSLNIYVLHIDHGLQTDSAAWAGHCRQVCADLQLTFQSESLHLTVPAGESVEAIARQARYESFAAYLPVGGRLLTAQHQDDQAETVLLNLFRGAGQAGLAAMPSSRPFAQGYLDRPFLAVSRADLQAYAERHSLHYIDDPSNTDTRFDRNYLRAVALPVLKQRWPAASQTLARSAQWQAEYGELLQELLQEKLAPCLHNAESILSCQCLKQYSPALQKALLRLWLDQQGFKMPSAKKLAHIVRDVVDSTLPANPCVAWQGCEVRRYQDAIYATRPLRFPNPNQVIEWPNRHQALHLAHLDEPVDVSSIRADTAQALLQTTKTVTVRFRQGGERIVRHGAHALELKNVLQGLQVPPWQRQRLPLVYVAEQLVAVLPVFALEPRYFLP